MSITSEEWQEYSEYLDSLSDEELKIELSWLESVGKAKKRGSFISFEEDITIQWEKYVK
jgi:hypothetical protein